MTHLFKRDDAAGYIAHRPVAGMNEHEIKQYKKDGWEQGVPNLPKNQAGPHSPDSGGSGAPKAAAAESESEPTVAAPRKPGRKPKAAAAE